MVRIDALITLNGWCWCAYDSNAVAEVPAKAVGRRALSLQHERSSIDTSTCDRVSENDVRGGAPRGWAAREGCTRVYPPLAPGGPELPKSAATCALSRL